MSEENLSLRSFRLKNFKAVRDSGEVRFTPLTVFIGNNGSGKSSLVEGLQAFQDITTQGLDEAMNRWRGFEHIHNPPIDLLRGVQGAGKNPTIEFTLKGDAPEGGTYGIWMDIAMSLTGDDIFIDKERINFRNQRFLDRDQSGDVKLADIEATKTGTRLRAGSSTLTPQVANNIMNQYYNDGIASPLDGMEFSRLAGGISRWQFVLLNPYSMGQPRPQRRSGDLVLLESDGSNIAEYLLEIRKEEPDAFEGIVETLQYVLPYVSDLQPNLTSELERAVYLQMTEEDYKIPGWLLSSGTLRVLALLALFRHPTPPPLIVIEEIENGLDPRTIHLIVEELRNLIETGLTQVIITTHSPYLLDLLALSQIVLVERIDGQPNFFRPSDQQELEEWAKDFGPGRLYTMNKLSRGGHR